MLKFSLYMVILKIIPSDTEVCQDHFEVYAELYRILHRVY